MIQEKLRSWVEEPSLAGISISKQCKLLGLPRSSFYYEPVPVSAAELELMKTIDKLFTQKPYYGRRKMAKELLRNGYHVNEKRVSRLMQDMGLKVP